MSDELLGLVKQSSETDLAFLLKAKEGLKKRLKETPGDEKVLSAFNRAKLAVEGEVKRLRGGGGEIMRVFKTQLDATAFLNESGFKISKSQLNRDVHKGLIATNAAGHYEEGSLLAYAAVHLDPTAKVEDKALKDVTIDRLEADTMHKRYAAERARLKYEKEQGLLMSRSRHEDELASRAAFFKAEIESFGYRVAGDVIAVVEGNDTKVPEFLSWWNEATADWMDAWSEERQFVNDDDTNALSEEGDV